MAGEDFPAIGGGSGSDGEGDEDALVPDAWKEVVEGLR